MKAKKRIKKKAARQPSENEIHMHCAAWLKKARPDLLAFHVANELKAHVSYHLKQRRLGKLNGVADWLVFPVGARKIAIELKDAEGVQDDNQIKFQKRWEHSGGNYYLVRTLQEFQCIVLFA